MQIWQKAGGIWGAIKQSNEKAQRKAETNSRAIKGHSRTIKGKQGKYGSCKGAEGGKKHEQDYELDQQN